MKTLHSWQLINLTVTSFLYWLRWWNKAKNVLSNDQLELEWWRLERIEIERHKVVSGKNI